MGESRSNSMVKKTNMASYKTFKQFNWFNESAVSCTTNMNLNDYV